MSAPRNTFTVRLPALVNVLRRRKKLSPLTYVTTIDSDTPVPGAATLTVTVNGEGPSPAPPTVLIDTCCHAVGPPRLPVAVPHECVENAGAKSVPLISAKNAISLN